MTSHDHVIKLWFPILRGSQFEVSKKKLRLQNSKIEQIEISSKGVKPNDTFNLCPIQNPNNK